MKIRLIFISIFFLFSTSIVKSQPCLQPGSLVSVFNLAKGKHEYLVFKFINPYNSKGLIAQGNSSLFGPLNKKGNTYHKITFSNVSNFCADKWILNLPQKKILDFKTPEMANGTVVYQFELAEGAKIVSHISYRHQIYYFVKIRIE